MNRAGSILPVCIHNNKLHFLFGKENELEPVESQGWSDFGGGCESGTPFQTALREGREESTGCLDPKELVKKGIYKLVLNKYHVFIVKMDYDPMLPLYYNRMHKFIIEKMSEPVPIVNVSIMAIPTIQLGDRIKIGTLDAFDIIDGDYWVISTDFAYGSTVTQSLVIRKVM